MRPPNKCEICWEEPASIECDDGVWRCPDCAILAGYAYLVDDYCKERQEEDLDEEDW